MFLRKFFKDESGQALSEYGLVLGVVAIAVIAALALLRDKIVLLFAKVAAALEIS
ncbi:MAG: Flp family type IVb pilin [Aminipila sp.]